MVVEASPSAAFIVPEADLLFQVAVVPFDAPALLGCGNKLFDAGVLRQVRRLRVGLCRQDAIDAAVELKPENREMVEGVRFPVYQPEALSTLFGQTGLKDVVVRPLDVPTRVSDFDDYWSPFPGGQFPAPAYTMSLVRMTAFSFGSTFAGNCRSTRTDRST